MNKDDYKEKIEEHRQPISLNGEERMNTRTSRRSSNQPAKPERVRKNPLLPILFAVFILIPVGFLIYIQVFYEPTPNETAVIKTDEVKFEENAEDSVDSGVADEVDENESDSDKDNDMTQDSDSADEGEPAGSVERVQPDEETEKEIVEVEPVQDESSSGKTHIVQPNETLYRIAMNYYNSPDAVEKIKEANGLTSDSISTGQSLILP